jgi:hypothetical protein
MFTNPGYEGGYAMNKSMLVTLVGLAFFCSSCLDDGTSPGGERGHFSAVITGAVEKELQGEALFAIETNLISGQEAFTVWLLADDGTSGRQDAIVMGRPGWFIPTVGDHPVGIYDETGQNVQAGIFYAFYSNDTFFSSESGTISITASNELRVVGSIQITARASAVGVTEGAGEGDTVTITGTFEANQGSLF